MENQGLEVSLRIAAIFMICIAIFDVIKLKLPDTGAALIFGLGILSAIGIAMQII